VRTTERGTEEEEASSLRFRASTYMDPCQKKNFFLLPKKKLTWTFMCYWAETIVFVLSGIERQARDNDK
jgi:hypothetical protein